MAAVDWDLAVLQWIAKVTGAQLADPSNVWTSLKSGVLLCQLVNCIKPGTIKRDENARLVQVIEMENIQLYLTALWEMGVPSRDLFITSDLFRGENLSAVLQSVHALHTVAVGIGWSGPDFPTLPTSFVKSPRSGMKKSRSMASVSQELEVPNVVSLQARLTHQEELTKGLEKALAEEKKRVATLQEELNSLKAKDRQSLQLSEGAKQKEVEAMRTEIASLQQQVKTLKQAADSREIRAQAEVSKLKLKEYEVDDLKEAVETLRNHIRESFVDDDEDDEEEEPQIVFDVKPFAGPSAQKPQVRPPPSSCLRRQGTDSSLRPGTTVSLREVAAGPSRGSSGSVTMREAGKPSAAALAAANQQNLPPELLPTADPHRWMYDPKEKIRTQRAARMARMGAHRRFATVELKLADDHDDDPAPDDKKEPKHDASSAPPKMTPPPSPKHKVTAAPPHQRSHSMEAKGPTASRLSDATVKVPTCNTPGCTKLRVVNKQHCAEHCVSQLNIQAGARPSTTVPTTTTSTLLNTGAFPPAAATDTGVVEDPTTASGQFFFRSEELGGLTQSTVLLAQRHLKQLLRNRKLSFKNIELLSDLFRTDSGRRVLVYILGSMCKTQSAAVILSQDNFEIVHHLVDNTFREMNLKLSKDIKSAMLLMRATKLLAWKCHGETRILRDYLLAHFADLPFSFWEEYYWRNMTGTSRHTMHTQVRANEQDVGWMKELFIETGFDMYTFGSTRQKIKEFIEHMILLTPGFSEGQLREVHAAVDLYPTRYYAANGRAQSPLELMALRSGEEDLLGLSTEPPIKGRLRWQVSETRSDLKRFQEEKPTE